MGRNSSIEWTHHTFNPWWGCVRVSPGCKNCYADTWARRLGLELWGRNMPRRFFSDSHWKEPLRWNHEAQRERIRRRVFCASMADVFEDRGELDPWRLRLWTLIKQTAWLDWLLLTKRPQRIGSAVPWGDQWPSNVWLGTTTENQHWAEVRLPALLQHSAAVLFVSAEPLVGSLDLRRFLLPTEHGRRLNWVIAGGESGAKARPMNPQWARDLRDQCARAGVPFHFKQWGHWSPEATATGSRAQRVTLTDARGRPVILVKAGKKASGRILDGKIWDGLPQSRAAA